MLDLQLPARHDWAVQEKHYGKLIMEPFEPGFALTVGIAYRRALLSAIHGAAPTWVKIEHVLHEFSHLPGGRGGHTRHHDEPPERGFRAARQPPEDLPAEGAGPGHGHGERL